MLLPYAGFICKSNSDETIERLSLSNNKTNEERGAVHRASEFCNMKSKNKGTWPVALGVLEHRNTAPRVFTCE
jgi:hypothetical protein